MKIVFLDIDGVLNSELFSQTNPKSDNTRYPLDPRCIKLLNELVKDTDCKIVISSSWRRSTAIDRLCELFAEAGFVGEIIDYTPFLGRGTVRGNEIRVWIQDNFALLGKRDSEFDTYVIFDDDSDMLLWQQYNFIHVDGFSGLTPRNCYKAKYILNKER